MQQNRPHTSATHNGNGHRGNGHHGPDILRKTHAQVTQEVLARTFQVGGAFWLLAAGAFALLVIGVIGFIIRSGDGFVEHKPWGYYGGMFSFLLTTAMAAPLASVLPRLVKAHWGQPISRIAEMWGIVGVFLMLMYIPLLVLLPGAAGRNTIWFYSALREGWPPGAPVTWQLVGITTLALLGLLLLWVPAIPDLAAARDHAKPGFRKGLWTALSLGWVGTHNQWKRVKTFASMLGPLYVMGFVFMQFAFSSDFGQSFVPAWKDSVFPAAQAVNGFQSAIALTIVTAFIMRQFGGFKDYIFLEQFWALAKLMLPLSIMWFYFWFSAFITFWYGRAPFERDVMVLLWFGPYRNIFIAEFILSFVMPLAMLIQNRVRRAILPPTLIAVGILVGMFFGRIRTYTATFSVPNEELGKHEMSAIPPVHFPDAADIMIIVGAIGGAMFLYLMATRIFPIMNIWEAKQALTLQKLVRVLKVELKAIGKPE